MTKEEAIRRIKSWNLDSDDMEVLSVVIPELAESEDEKIRKELLEEIEFIIPHEDETNSEGLILPSYHTRIDRYKSYLEKQKEQKPAECSYPYGRNETADRLVSLAECLEMDGDCLFNEHTGTEWGKFLRDLARKVEDKPSEWGDDDKTRLKAEWSEDEKARIDRIVDVLDWAEDKGRISYSDWEEYVCYVKSLKPQLKQEWSEEDETRLKVIKEELERFIMFGQYRTPLSVDDIDWLKTLPERFNLQPKQEWSEDWQEEDVQTRFAFYTYKDDPSVLYLSNVFVEETSRNHGFGTRILRAAEKVAETIGATTISLKVKQNSPANAWYRKNGYGYVAFEDGYDWLEKNLEYMKPNKQEWSEDDADFINMLILHFNYLINKGGDSVETYKSYIKGLKSLPPQPHTVSIKDATKFGNLEYERGVKDGIQSEKSRQWKPSEEQVEALDDTIFFEKTVFRKKKLVSLLEDLKKLM